MSRKYKRYREERVLPSHWAVNLTDAAHGVIAWVSGQLVKVATVSIVALGLSIIALAFSAHPEAGSVVKALDSLLGWVGMAGVFVIFAREAGSRYGPTARREWLTWTVIATLVAWLIYLIFFRVLWAATLLSIWTVVSFVVLDEEAIEAVIYFFLDW